MALSLPCPLIIDANYSMPQFPALYQQGPRNLFFEWFRVLGWMGNGVYTSIMIFFPSVIIFSDQAFRSEGQTADMTGVGTVMFTCTIWAVNCQIIFSMSHFTWIQHFLIWGSIALWYIFLVIYGELPYSIPVNAHKILREALTPAPIFWSTTFIVTVACIIPYLAHICFQRIFNPLDHQIIQELKYYRKHIEDKRMWRRERIKAREATKIGFTARVDAKIKQLKGKLHKKQSVLNLRGARHQT